MYLSILLSNLLLFLPLTFATYGYYHRPAVHIIQAQGCRPVSCAPQPCIADKPCVPNYCPPIQPWPACPSHPRRVCPPPIVCPYQYPCPVCPVRPACTVYPPCKPLPTTTTSAPCTTPKPVTCNDQATKIKINIKNKLNYCIQSEYLQQIFETTYFDYSMYSQISTVAFNQFSIQNLTQLYIESYKEYNNVLNNNFALQLQLKFGTKNEENCGQKNLEQKLDDVNKGYLKLEKHIVDLNQQWIELLNQKSSKCYTGKNLNICDARKQWYDIKIYFMKQFSEQKLIDEEIKGFKKECEKEKENKNKTVIDGNTWEFSGGLSPIASRSHNTVISKNTEELKTELKIQKQKKELNQFCTTKNKNINEKSLVTGLGILKKQELVEKFTTLYIRYINTLKITKELNLKLIKTATTNKINSTCNESTALKLKNQIIDKELLFAVSYFEVFYLNSKISTLTLELKDCLPPKKSPLIKG